MCVFARRTEQALDVAIERPQHTDARMYQEVATFSGADQATDRGLPLIEALLCLWQFHDVVGGILQRGELAAPGSGIGSPKSRFQPRLATGAPVRRLALVTIEAAIFLDGPSLLIAPFLKIGIATLWQIVSPCRFERCTRVLEVYGSSASLLARHAARVEAAMPLPRFCRVCHARSFDDHPDANASKVDVPGSRAIVDAFAGEGGHALLKRGPNA
jgi:hypothetical protein